MRIPEIQAELATISERLVFLANELSRRTTKKRTDRFVSRRMTPAVRREIRAMALAEPDLTQAEIAERVGVNSGRVSETLHGFRE